MYMQLFTDAPRKDMHDQGLLLRYLYLGDTAFRFGITDLANWAWEQLGLVLKSARKLAGAKWDKLMMLKMLSHFDAMLESKPEVAFELSAFFRLILSTSTQSHPSVVGTQPTSSFDTCLMLYKESLLLEEPVRSLVLGYTFVVILSLGHQSSIWKDQLTRDQRYTLYTAQAHLVSLRDNQHLDLGWIQGPKKSQLLGLGCSDCSERFVGPAWRLSFGLCEVLNSRIPLEDVTKLAHLPVHRQVFAETVRFPARPCKNCGERILREIDVYLNNLFHKQLPAAYSHFSQ
jgi:hypothetical protein